MLVLCMSCSRSLCTLAQSCALTLPPAIYTQHTHTHTRTPSTLPLLIPQTSWRAVCRHHLHSLPPQTSWPVFRILRRLSCRRARPTPSLRQLAQRNQQSSAHPRPLPHFWASSSRRSSHSISLKIPDLLSSFAAPIQHTPTSSSLAPCSSSPSSSIQPPHSRSSWVHCLAPQRPQLSALLVQPLYPPLFALITPGSG